MVGYRWWVFNVNLTSFYFLNFNKKMLGDPWPVWFSWLGYHPVE